MTDAGTDGATPPIHADLEGRVAVVTGGTRGIGRAITEAFAAAGADVVPTSRTAADVEAAVAAVKDVGGRSLAQPTDVTDRDAVAALFEQVIDELGGVDVLVNNAGANPQHALGTPEDVGPEAFAETVAINLEGAYACLHEAGPALRADGGGAAINVASTAGLIGFKRMHAYVAAKHGLVGLTRSAALDWAPAVRVNAIAPGYVETEFTAGVREREDLYESIVAETPMGRFATPEEVASAAAFLASDMASFVTGECLVLDGGWTTQ